ncbi:hypothetical protein OUZ56_002293 [Daphnia magna]|uniref:Uncharacterized protein n=1 Tax=Daphnia magna TaxID=35525 RepID=A0ABR0A577_9CRUS|nr:hypothetical protein OUZ56_002293 [Daphnia magna]
MKPGSDANLQHSPLKFLTGHERYIFKAIRSSLIEECYCFRVVESIGVTDGTAEIRITEVTSRLYSSCHVIQRIFFHFLHDPLVQPGNLYAIDFAILQTYYYSTYEEKKRMKLNVTHTKQ